MIPIIVLAVVAIFSGTDDRVKTAVMVEPSIEQCRADKATLDAALQANSKVTDYKVDCGTISMSPAQKV